MENDWGERKTVVKWGDFGPFVEGTKVRVWSKSDQKEVRPSSPKTGPKVH